MRELFLAIDSFTIPGGATSGTRIVFDGPSGTIRFFDENDALVGSLSPDSWEIGDLDTPGSRVTLDPSGALRIRNASDILVSTLDQQGYTLRETTSGLVVAEIRAGHLRLVDPTGTDDIELTTSTAGTMPNPAWRSLVEGSPGATVVVPAAPVFTSTPASDLSIGHVAAWLRNTVQSSTWSQPDGVWTERLDDDTAPDDSTLSVSVATRAATTGAARIFTNTESDWQQGIGSHVVIRGGEGAAPAFQSESHTGDVFTFHNTLTFSLSPPSGTCTDRILIAFVSLGNDGGGVPTGWEAPEGWVFLGANFGFSGSGSTLSTLAVGVWAKLGTASEPASYPVTINMGAGRKTFHACIVAVSTPFLIDGGANIRIAGHPIRRLLAFQELQAAADNFTFSDIPQGYDHLEVVYTGRSDRGTDARRNLSVQFNGDTGANYHMQVNRDNVLTQILSTTRIMVGSINGAVLDHETGGRFNIYDYTHTGERRMLLGDAFYLEAGQLVEETDRGLWLNTADPITSILLRVEVGPTLFNSGSRAYLYGY